MEAEKKAGKHSPFFGMPLFFLPLFSPSRPSVSCLQHDTSAQLGFAILEACVCVCVRISVLL